MDIARILVDVMQSKWIDGDVYLNYQKLIRLIGHMTVDELEARLNELDSTDYSG